MFLSVPLLLGPPQAYNALKAVAREGSVYVPGTAASPIMVILILRMVPSDTSTKVLPVLMFPYSVPANFFVMILVLVVL